MLYNDLPSDEIYIKYSTPFPDNSHHDRYRIFLTNDLEINKKIFGTDSLWNNLIEWYFNSNIIDLYLNKYNIVKQKYLNYSLSLQLVRDYQNYQIKIHTDSSSRQITSLIYFPSPESDKNDGTIFFTNLIKNQKVKDSKEKFDFNDGFEEIKKFEYLPNTSIDFQVSKNSWYGVYPTKSK